ncbi:MAG: hypothetical protein U1F66_03495 [bacterium]
MEASETVPEAPDRGADRLAWILVLIPLFLVAWALREYPQNIRKAADQIYILSIGTGSLLKMALVFYGLYLVPGLMALARRVPPAKVWSVGSPSRILLSFALGMTAHVGAIFLQKYLRLPYHPASVLLCLGAAYAFFLWTLRFLPLSDLLAGDPRKEQEAGWETWASRGLLLLGLVLGLEMTLRGRGSSLSLTGDGYPHLINTLGTLMDGPLPDGLPFFSTFILNIHPMAFHALLANLKTLTPGLLHIDLFRYFSVLMVPVFLFCMQGFFAFLARSRLVGAMAAFAALWVSGGGLSLRIPIVYFPWYWSIAWCLSAAVFFLLLKGELRFPALGLAAGLVFGAGVLLHPFFAFRMGTIMAWFLPLELLRRWLAAQPLRPVWASAWRFAVGAALPVAAWLGPLLWRHSWEPTYDYDYLVANFSQVAPEAIEYLKAMKGSGFHLPDLWVWSRLNAGLWPVLGAPVGLFAMVRRYREPAAALLGAWLLGMGSAILLAYLPNPYRYFEYFFYGLVALGAFGLGWLAGQLSGWRRSLLLLALLCVSALHLSQDFFPKYRLALSLYGRTSLSDLDVRSAESRAYSYFEAKRAGRLDLEYGGYRGYLWSRQKKVWDIYLKTKAPRPNPK